MSRQSLLAFTARVQEDLGLQQRLAKASSMAAVIRLAASLGFSLTAAELRRASRDLAAPYWPWAARGRLHRYRFFAATESTTGFDSSAVNKDALLATLAGHSAA